MNSYVMYIVVTMLLIISYFKDKNKTRMVIKKAYKAFQNILPQFLGVIILVGILLSVFNAELISKIIGNESGWIGVIVSAIVGAITLIPGFVAFPTSAMLLNSGAGYMQIGAFVSALMMVGIVTAPVEIKYFGKRITIIRNFLSFLFCFIVAYIIGKVVGGI
ncbi:permease [Sporosalibacterium faouarense]|uniref:permease n=1 Tax=Sporosalibacterium faouarense TaxID=516123 RepID=UPI00141C1533|nr:permease [Sporosalibacterium faouarense]MTI48790.1 permease [Bacillota bacterium]